MKQERDWEAAAPGGAGLLVLASSSSCGELVTFKTPARVTEGPSLRKCDQGTG